MSTALLEPPAVASPADPPDAIALQMAQAVTDRMRLRAGQPPEQLTPFPACPGGAEEASRYLAALKDAQGILGTEAEHRAGLKRGKEIITDHNGQKYLESFNDAGFLAEQEALAARQGARMHGYVYLADIPAAAQSDTTDFGYRPLTPYEQTFGRRPDPRLIGVLPRRLTPGSSIAVALRDVQPAKRAVNHISHEEDAVQGNVIYLAIVRAGQPMPLYVSVDVAEVLTRAIDRGEWAKLLAAG